MIQNLFNSALNNLKKRVVDEEESEAMNIKTKLHKLRMEDKDDEDFEIVKEDFEEVVHKFKQKSTKAYDLIIKSDTKYQEAFFELCKFFI
jgi:hypothetical protein